MDPVNQVVKLKITVRLQSIIAQICSPFVIEFTLLAKADEYRKTLALLQILQEMESKSETNSNQMNPARFRQ